MAVRYMGDGQRISSVRQTVENDLFIATKGQEFELIRQIEREMTNKTEKYPVTNSTFNEIKDYQSKVLDGQRGSKRPPG